MKSWYKMFRGWQDSPCFTEKKYSERDAWIWLIENAAFKDTIVNISGKPVTLKRGQICFSLRFLSQKFGWTIKKTRVFIDKLATWSMCGIDRGTGRNVLTICKYKEFQDFGHDKGTARGTAGAQQGHKEEELKELKEFIYIGDDKEIKETDLPAQPSAAPKKRGMRLKDWLAQNDEDAIGRDWGIWARDTLFLEAGEIDAEMQKFCDYWNARAGQGGVKLDWPATWRNWMRKYKEVKTEKEKRNELYRRK